MGWQYYREIERWLMHMEPRDWVWVFVAALVIGLVCMRGLGSRLR